VKKPPETKAKQSVTLPFDEMRKRIEVRVTQKAAVKLHEELMIARSIVRDIFGGGDPDLILQVRKLLRQEEEYGE